MTPSQTAEHRLIRRTDDRIVAGVASGVADYLNIDPVLVRVGFVVLAFFGGTGILAYVALWILTPEGVPGHPVAARPAGQRGAAFWVAIALFVLAGLAIADAIFDRSIVWPLVLIGAGVALWRSDLGGGSPARPDAPAATPAPPPSAADPIGPSMADTGAEPPRWTPPPPPGTATRPAWPSREPTQPIRTPSARWTPPPPPGEASPSGPGASAPRPWQPPRSRQRSILGRITLALALLVVGLAWGLGEADVIEFTARTGFALALLVIGLGLIVGTWVGRARWLTLPAAVVLVPGLVVTSAIGDFDLHLAGGIGAREYEVVAVEQVRDQYELGIGELVVDLSTLDFEGQTIETEIDLGIGELVLYVPEGVTLEADTRVLGGEINVVGQTAAGTRADRTVLDPGDEGAGRLRVDAAVTFGELRIERR